ncbi:sigma-54 dependent transcriptional regulator [uncultured Croceicoccus sp.]|uniref:sigma-54-dependent transcriptional regulator n=1 Tax=uncultured Croceicoccus sp. TaxID=1295329 RepID=UPI00261611F1|nr:sigma-54 dependent transcriptional regulator [uncultured Croceicoccus sp.]
MADRSVLIIEDSASLALGYVAQLEEAGYVVTLATTLAEAREQLSKGSFAAALLDLQLPDGDGLELLGEKAEGAPSFVVVTSDGSLSRAIAAMRSGAFDFLVKPVAGARLLSTIQAAVEHAPDTEPAVEKLPDGPGFHGFVGRSPAMRKVYETIAQIADSRAAVFVTGESGTGKEVTAEALHAAGRRRHKAFVAINCGAIPENLLESELFGHVKGAFTGAVENRIGAAKAADGGTLFLDEICEMELKLQVKLLRFLQTGMIQRVGSAQVEPVDVRIVCATNRDPYTEMAEGRFREDLFYRLNVIPIALPPLRERGEDVMLLAETLAERIAREEGRGPMRLTADSRAAILTNPWAGNVRELQNALRRAIVTAPGDTIELHAPTAYEIKPPPPISAGGAAFHAPPAGPSPAPHNGSFDLAGRTLAQIERDAIEGAIARHGGNLTRAARELDVSASTLYRKMEKWRTVS